jgi:hypothetical protein
VWHLLVGGQERLETGEDPLVAIDGSANAAAGEKRRCSGVGVGVCKLFLEGLELLPQCLDRFLVFKGKS